MKNAFVFVAILCTVVGCEPTYRIDENGKKTKVLTGTEQFGYEARLADVPAEANPYLGTNVPAAERWLQGWIEASNELRNSSERR